MSIGGRCDFGAMDWHRCMADGHEGPHTSEPLPDDIERWEDSRRLCAVCDKPIRVGELCAECAVGNDPFPEMADR